MTASDLRVKTWQASTRRRYRYEPSDLLSALYLRYCDMFVPDDKGQLGCLTEIAAAASLSVKIVRYKDFKLKFIS